MTAIRRAFVLVATAAGLAGCGNLTAGGEDAEVHVAVSGDAEEQTAQAAIAPTPGARPAGELDEPEGEIEVEFRLFLVDGAGRAIALTDQDVRVRIDVRGRQEAEVVRTDVRPGRYPTLRIVFTEIDVDVDSGLIVDGRPIVGPVDVELEGDRLTVERGLDLDLDDGDRVALVVDLNTTTWLRSTDPDLRRVAGAIVRTAIDVRVRAASARTF